MFRLIVVLILPLLLTSCGLHGPNVVFEVNVDKRDQSEVISAPDNGPALTREEWQEILGYVREAMKLVKAVARDREIQSMLRIGKFAAVQEAIRSADTLQPPDLPRPKSTLESMSDLIPDVISGDPIFE